MGHPPEKVPPIQNPPSSRAAVGPVILSAFGLTGWLVLLVLLQPYQEPERGNIGPAVANFFAFGVNFVLVVIGLLVCGTLSFSGLLTGAIALGHSHDRLSLTAVALGAAGLLLGAAILIWRYAVISS